MYSFIAGNKKIPAGKKCPGGGKTSRTRPDTPWGPLSLMYNGYRIYFPGVKRPGRGFATHHHLAPTLRKSGAIPLFALWAFMVCSKVNFIFESKNKIVCVFTMKECGGMQ
jgi:hypothetical protein